MTKRILLTITCLALLLSLAACVKAPSTDETGTDPSVSESKPATESTPATEAEQEKFSPLTLVDNEQVTVKNEKWGRTDKGWICIDYCK